MPRSAFVGFTTTPIPNYELFMPAVKAPSNYKDPVKIKEYVSAALEKQVIDAAVLPLTSAIDKFAVLRTKGADGKVEKVQVDWPSKVPLYEFLEQYDNIWSLDASMLFRLLRFDYIACKGKLPGLTSKFVSCPGEPVANRWIYDPIEMLVGTTSEDWTNPVLVARRSNLLLP